MKMPDIISDIMLAPCGMNCAVCYKHVGIRKSAKPCAGCLKGDEGKPEHCRVCKIKTCAKENGHTHCFECADFPCKLIKNLEKSYNKRYNASVVENSNAAKENGITAFLEQDRQKWTCAKCGGAFSLHDGVCSECGSEGLKNADDTKVDISQRIAMLYEKDSSAAFANTKELELISEQSNSLYCYFDDFLEMLKSEKYVIRVRGFRLLCKQAKWDTDKKIDSNLNTILDAVNDEKPTAVRQVLLYLTFVVPYKKELNEQIRNKALSIDVSRFNDSMRPLIIKDIQKLVELIELQRGAKS